MKFTIDRKTWLRGEGTEDSALLRSSDDKKCCLGFYLEACGVPPLELTDQSAPCDIKPSRLKEGGAAWLLRTPEELARVPRKFHSDSCESLMQANDRENISYLTGDEVWTEQQREAFITEEFAEHGVEVEFIG